MLANRLVWGEVLSFFYKTLPLLLLDDWAWILVTGFEYVCSHRDEMLFRKRK
jgi:hypothetical protein